MTGGAGVAMAEPHEVLRERVATALRDGSLDWGALLSALADFEVVTGPDAEYDLASDLWEIEDDCSRGWITDDELRARVAALLAGGGDGAK